MLKPGISVRELNTDDEVKFIPLTSTSSRRIDRVMSGLLRNMDLDRFYAEVVDVPGYDEEDKD